jgi:hypothetical protein
MNKSHPLDFYVKPKREESMNKSHPKDTLVTKSEVWATMQPAKHKDQLDAVISLFRDRKTAEIFRQPGEYIESWCFIKSAPGDVELLEAAGVPAEFIRPALF